MLKKKKPPGRELRRDGMLHIGIRKKLQTFGLLECNAYILNVSTAFVRKKEESKMPQHTPSENDKKVIMKMVLEFGTLDDLADVTIREVFRKWSGRSLSAPTIRAKHRNLMQQALAEKLRPVD